MGRLAAVDGPQPARPLESRSSCESGPRPSNSGLEGDQSEAKVFRILLVEAELNRLRRRKAQAFDLLDEQARELAEAGIAAELSKPLKLIQRYESACWRRQQAAYRILNGRPCPPVPAATRPVAERKPASPPTRPRAEVRDDPPFRPAGSKPMSAMSRDEGGELYEIIGLLFVLVLPARLT